MTRFSFAALAGAAMSAAMVVPTFASVLLNETFSYPDGELGAASGGIWKLHSGAGGQTIVSGALFINDGDFIATGDPNNTAFTGDYHRAFTGPAATSGVVYSGFDITVSAVDAPFSTFTDGYFAHFAQNTPTENADFHTFHYTGRISQIKGAGETSSASADSYGLGIINTGMADSTPSNATYFADEPSVGVKYRYVTAYDFTTNVATLWVNPVSASSPSVSSSVGNDAPTSLGYYAFRLGTKAFDGDETIDNLVIANTFAEAAGTSVPEPACIAGMVFFSATLLRRR